MNTEKYECPICGEEIEKGIFKCLHCKCELDGNESNTKASKNTAKVSLWKPETVGNLSIIFTPIFGSLLLSKNWKSLNEAGKAKLAICWAYAGIAIIIVSMFLESGLTIALPFLIVWYFAECRKQSKYVKQKLDNNYERKPWGMAVLKGIGIVVLSTIVLIVGEYIVNTSNLEESAVPVVNQILEEYGRQRGINLAKCLNVEIIDEFAENRYKAQATLENGNKLNILIEDHGDKILVRILE